MHAKPFNDASLGLIGLRDATSSDLQFLAGPTQVLQYYSPTFQHADQLRPLHGLQVFLSVQIFET
jgi:hypothetical protein